MPPLSGGIPARRFPIVNVLLIVTNFAKSSATSCRTSTQRSTTPRSTRAALTAPAGRRSRGASGGSPPCSCTAAGITSWATRCSSAIFGKNVEDVFGSLAYLVFYFAAMMTQTAMTLLFGAAQDARVPELGASGAVPAVLDAYFVLYAGSRILTYIFPIFLVRIPAWIFLGLWFLYQLIEASFGLFNASGNGGGVAFFAHVGGFIFGLLAARLLARAGQAAPRDQWRSTA